MPWTTFLLLLLQGLIAIIALWLPVTLAVIASRALIQGVDKDISRKDRQARVRGSRR